MKSNLRRWVSPAIMVVAALNLGGCVVAAVPVVLAATAATVAVAGFAVYKTVQTASGGTVRIEFGSKDSKKAPAAAPLPKPNNSIYIWDNSARERAFAAKVKASPKFRTVKGGEDGGADLAKMQPDEISKTLDKACGREHVDLVVAAVDQGSKVSSNMLSFKRGNSTQRLELDAFSCSDHRNVWTENMAVVIESGSKAMSQSEIDTVAGEAWAERLLEAKK